MGVLAVDEEVALPLLPLLCCNHHFPSASLLPFHLYQCRRGVRDRLERSVGPAMSSSSPRSPRGDTAALAANAALMDKYSRQIGAFGMEAMSKLMSLKVP